MESFHKLFFYLGRKLRNPNVMHWYWFLKESESWDRQQLSEYQTEQCRKLLIFARDYSPFWKKRFEDHGLVPENFSSIEELQKLPPITKQDLIQNNDTIQSNYPFKKLFYSETSGSTGEPLSFHRNEKWDSLNRAAMWRGYSWFNIHPWERSGYLWGYSFNRKEKIKSLFLDWLQNRFRLFTYEENEILSFLRKLKKAQYLEGYASMIYELAKTAEKKGFQDFTNLTFIKGTSEKIFNSYQSLSQKIFNKKIVSEYGAVESGIIAFECPQGNMHINMEQVIVEEMDNEIVVTNLHSLSFPIIRYKLGDYIELKNEGCSCGMKHPLIRNIIGRVGKRIYGRKKIYPSITLYYIFKNLLINHRLTINYKAIQHHEGHIIIHIEQDIDLHQQGLVKKEAIKYFGDDLKIQIKTNHYLHTYQEKKKDFISMVE